MESLCSKNVQAVIFDMDGVIFDSESLVLQCWDVIAQKYGIQDVRKVCKMCLGTNAKESMRIFKEVYGEQFPYADYKKEMSALYHHTVKCGGLQCKPGIKELLNYLKENHYKIGLASSTRREVVESQLSNAGLLKYFHVIVCGDMVSKSKPEPDIYLKASTLLDICPENAYAIEDSYNGIRSAYQAGMNPIMVPDLMEPTEEMKTKTVAILQSLHDVIIMLEATI